MTFKYLLVVVVWVVTILRLPLLRHDRAQRSVWLAVAAVAVSWTTLTVPGFPAVVPHLAGVAFAVCLLRLLHLTGGRTGGRGQYALAAAVAVTLGTLNVISGGIGRNAQALSDDQSPSTILYWVVLEVYLGAVLVTATWIFGSFARHAAGTLLRIGLVMMAAGTALLAVFAAVRTALIVAHGLGATIDFAGIEPSTTALQVTGFLLVLTGILVPAGRRARSTVATYRSLIALRPLWTAMHRAFPEVVLFTPGRALLELGDAELRLYRRVIEIRDGMLALRDHLPTRFPYAPEAAPDDPAVAEARAILLALHRHAAGERPADQPGSWAPVGPAMTDEVAWLTRVSRAYRRLRREAARQPEPAAA